MMRIALWLLLALSAPALGAPVLRGSGACTPNEKWELPPSAPRWLRIILTAEAGQSPQLADGRVWAEAFASSAAQSPLGKYARGRLLLERGLVEEAVETFLDAAQKTPGTAVSLARDASLECVSQIHQRYLFLPSGAHEREVAVSLAPTSLGGRARRALARLLARHYLKAMLQGESHGAMQERALAVMESEGLRRLAAMFREGSGEWALSGERLATELARLQPPLVDESVTAFLRLANARALAQSGDAEGAVAAYEKVPGGTPWSLAARGEMAALQLQAKDSNAALGTAYELRDSTGEWTPEAYESLVRSVLGACAYPEVLKGASRFKKAYLGAWQWLQKNANGPLYRELVAFLRGKTAMPRAVGERLATSPDFLSLQQQLNLTIDAREKMPAVGSLTGVASSVRYQWVQRLNELRRRNADNERQLMAKLDTRLSRAAQNYFERLRQVRDQLELMEIDANSHVGQEADVAQAIARGDTAPGPEWHWGKAVLFAEEGPGERWADEAGKMRGNLKTYCANN